MADETPTGAGTQAQAPAAKRTVAAPDGLSVKQAAKRIEALDLDQILGGTEDERSGEPVDDEETPPSAAKPSKSKPKKEEPVEEDDDKDEPLDEDEDEDDEDDVDEDDDEPVEEDEGEQEEQGDEGDLFEFPNDAKVRVKVDGKWKVVTAKEALAGYSRTDSFTKKSQAHAENVKVHEAHVAAKEAEIRTMQEHYVSQLAALEDALAQPEPDWAKIRSERPDQFPELHAAWQIHKSEIEKIRTEREAEELKLTQQARVTRAKLIESERAKLVEAVPEWADKTEKGEKLRQGARKYGLSLGYKPEELESVADSRAFKLLIDGYRYQQLLAKQRKAAEKGKGKVDALVQKTLVSGKKQSVSKTRRTKQASNMARLKQTGNLRDAAAVIEGLID